MPNLPKPRLRRPSRSRVDTTAAAPTAPEPNVEVIERPGLRWINIERPGPVDRAWLEEHFEFHPLTYEDVASRNQRPKVDEFDDYLFIVLHFPVFDSAVGRLNAGELDIFIGADFIITLPNTPLQPVEYLFERCRTSEEARHELFFDDIVDASERIWDMLENYKEVVQALEETNEGVISHRLNDILLVLTSLSVVILPLTLIASIWGMNVRVPGQGSIEAFWIIIGVMFVLLVGTLGYFRHRGWL